MLVATAGVFLLGFSSIFTGLNFITTIHKFRPQGMGWFRLPLNVWAIYATGIMQVLATPVLGITVLLRGNQAPKSSSETGASGEARVGAIGTTSEVKPSGRGSSR